MAAAVTYPALDTSAQKQLPSHCRSSLRQSSKAMRHNKCHKYNSYTPCPAPAGDQTNAAGACRWHSLQKSIDN